MQVFVRKSAGRREKQGAWDHRPPFAGRGYVQLNGRIANSYAFRTPVAVHTYILDRGSSQSITCTQAGRGLVSVLWTQNAWPPDIRRC